MTFGGNHQHKTLRKNDRFGTFKIMTIDDDLRSKTGNCVEKIVTRSKIKWLRNPQKNLFGSILRPPGSSCKRMGNDTKHNKKRW